MIKNNKVLGLALISGLGALVLFERLTKKDNNFEDYSTEMYKNLAEDLRRELDKSHEENTELKRVMREIQKQL